MLCLTEVFHKNKDAYKDSRYKYIVNQGGTSSSKTFSILQLLTAIAYKHKKQIDIVGLSVPHLKTGVLNDIPKIFEQYGLNFDIGFNHTDKFYKFDIGGVINFLSFDNLGKAHGGRRDILYLNEANHLDYNIVEQLMSRTRDKIFIDYNPTNAFWVHTQLMAKESKKLKLIKSTYKDNQFLEQSIIDFIESRRGDGNNNYWRVYGLGELGKAEGLIFDNVEERKFTPDELQRFDRIYEGIDWGFAVDPFVFIQCYLNRKHRTLYIFNEVYGSGITNNKAIQSVKTIHKPGAEIIADSEEPKSIYDFQDSGLPVIKARKGPGSISYGIKKLQELIKIYIDPERCPNAYREFVNYSYEQDRNGGIKSIYPDKDNHTIDAVRYALENVFST